MYPNKTIEMKMPSLAVISEVKFIEQTRHTALKLHEVSVIKLWNKQKLIACILHHRKLQLCFSLTCFMKSLTERSKVHILI